LASSLLLAIGEQAFYSKPHARVNIPKVSCDTHRYIEEPPEIKGINPNILISIKPYLGKSNNQVSVQGLKFQSNYGNLTLRDEKGLIHKAPEINIGWKKVPLLNSLKIRRKVIGPFASFESAETIASYLRKERICAVIANPSKWEVWVSPDIKLPKEIKSNSVEKNIKYELKPLLEIASNKYNLSGLVEISSTNGIKWEGGIYTGIFLLKPDAYGTWTLIEKISLEKYLEGVVPHEIGFNSPLSALKAQSVLARTWALANSKRYSVDGYHLCSSTQCQVYKNPNEASSSIKFAIQETSSQVLSVDGKPIKAFYHASNGGVTAKAEEAWHIDNLRYLTGRVDAPRIISRKYKLPLKSDQLNNLLSEKHDFYGSQHRLFRWRRIVSEQDIKENLIKAKYIFDFPTIVNVLERGDSGRVLSLEILGETKNSKVLLKLDEIRRTLPFLPSTLFKVKKLEEGVWEFYGGGFGHGVGLSQAGAIDLALRGWSTRAILNHYFPGTKYGPLPEQ